MEASKALLMFAKGSNFVAKGPESFVFLCIFFLV